jgi:hypothetical protein
MSTHEKKSSLSDSYDCPLQDGERMIQRVSARTAEIGGGISVNRLLPSRQRRMIGAWCFLDHAGPASFKAGTGMKVGPHPHTGLQTFTWMIEGEVLHRDSLGNAQRISPQQVNLMTAGRGISHTEESLSDETQLHAAQLWIALPHSERNCAPAFDHHPDLPGWDDAGCHYVLLAGSYNHQTAPAKIYSPLLGMDLFSKSGAAPLLTLQAEFEYGLLPLAGEVKIGEQKFVANELAYLGCGRDQLPIELSENCRALLLGGKPFAEEIFIWWNFVGHSKGEIIEAQGEWERGGERFGKIPGCDDPPLLAPPIPWATRGPG